MQVFMKQRRQHVSAHPQCPAPRSAATMRCSAEVELELYPKTVPYLCQGVEEGVEAADLLNIRLIRRLLSFSARYPADDA